MAGVVPRALVARPSGRAPRARAAVAAGRILDPGEARVGPGRSGDEWAKLLAAFHDDETLAAHRALAARLRAAASAVAREGARGEIGAPSHPGGGGTVVHGDFKLANIIFPPVAEVRDAAMDASGAATDVVDDRGRRRGAQPSAPDPAVIDWQWAGPGAAAQDVLYFFATSLSLDALHRADELLARYHARLVADLRARGEAGTAAAEAYDLDRLSRDIDVQATDYARFAMGSMWGEVTPESMARDAPKQNVGMHRRSLPHLHWLVRRAAKGLDAMECERPGDAPPPDPDAPPKRPEKDPAPKRGGPVARLVAELLGTCVFLADEAGDIVRGVAERGHLGVVRDKSDASGANAAKSPAKKRAKKKSSADAPAAVAVDPQTQADRRAERLIVSALRRTFGSVVRVVGEESSEGALAAKGETNADGTVDAVDADVPAAPPRAARGGHGSVRAGDSPSPGLEVGPARAARLREKYPDEPHAACAESDVVVWVDPLTARASSSRGRNTVRGHHSHGRLRGRDSRRRGDSSALRGRGRRRDRQTRGPRAERGRRSSQTGAGGVWPRPNAVGRAGTRSVRAPRSRTLGGARGGAAASRGRQGAPRRHHALASNPRRGRRGV